MITYWLWKSLRRLYRPWWHQKSLVRVSRTKHGSLAWLTNLPMKMFLKTKICWTGHRHSRRARPINRMTHNNVDVGRAYRCQSDFWAKSDRKPLSTIKLFWLPNSIEFTSSRQCKLEIFMWIVFINILNLKEEKMLLFYNKSEYIFRW